MNHEELVRLLAGVRVVAMVGASNRPERPSHDVMRFLQARGYRVVPVNPGLAGQTLLGEMVWATLADVPDAVDMVDVFRASDQVGPVADGAVAIGARVLWMQLGVTNAAAADRARAAGLVVVEDRCPKIELLRAG